MSVMLLPRAAEPAAMPAVPDPAPLLEYLDTATRERQRDAVLAVIPTKPTRVDDLVGEFLACLEKSCP